MIIRSKSENDTYKFNMSYLMMVMFPKLETEFTFQNRNKDEKFDQDFVDALGMEIERLKMLSLTEDEMKFMQKEMYWIPSWYFEWYKNADIFNQDIEVGLDKDGRLIIKSRGLGYKNTFLETNILPIFSALRNKYYGYDKDFNRTEAMDRLKEQISLSNDKKLYFSEFGLRRRYSGMWQDDVDDYISKNAKYCTGNSNVYEAYRCGQRVSGTQAHEIYMIFNALYGYREGAYKCVDAWQEKFNGFSGILLPDTVGIDAFLKQLTTHHAKTCDGFRHDSGPWESFVTKIIKRLKELHVNPLSKSMIFSNSINMQDLDDINNNVSGRVGFVAGGIGGALTNNTGNRKANPNCVMKISRVRFDENSPWINCVKCPDEEGKNMGDPEEVELCLKQTGRK